MALKSEDEAAVCSGCDEALKVEVARKVLMLGEFKSRFLEGINFCFGIKFSYSGSILNILIKFFIRGA